MEKEIDKLSNKILRLIRISPLWSATVTFIIGFIFGSGSLWSYLDYDLKTRDSYRDDVETVRRIQSDKSDINRDILSHIYEYISVRDQFILNQYQKKELKVENNYELRVQFEVAKSRIIGLVADYNRLEAQRSFFEETQPIWFPIGPMIPLLPPNTPDVTVTCTEKNGPGQVAMQFEKRKVDEVIVGVRRNLELLYKELHQEYPPFPLPSTRQKGESKRSNKFNFTVFNCIDGMPESK